MAPLTKDFHDLVRNRARRDAGFRRGLLREAIEQVIAGDFGTAKIILRDYVNATIGFDAVADATAIPAKSLMRMLGPHGNPTITNVCDIIGYLQRVEGVEFHVVAAGRARGRAAKAS